MATDGYQLQTGATSTAGLVRQGQSQLEELMLMLTSVIYGMWRYRWPALLLAWVKCIGGWLFVYGIPDVYRASTRVYIDTESMIKRVVGDLAISGDMMGEINMLTRVMLSQPRLEQTARLADLDLRVKSPKDHEELINNLRSRIVIAREGGDNIFRITYEDSNRVQAETVVTTLLEGFFEDAQGERRTDSGAAASFLEAQISEYEKRLNDAEVRLATFKRENIGLMPGETGDYYTRLQSAMAALASSRAELRLAEERRAEYSKQLAGEEPVFGVVQSQAAGSPSTGNSLLAQYEGELETLLLKYTDNHPDVVALKQTIERLRGEQQARAPVSSGVAARPSNEPLEANPVYQRMRMGLSEAEVEIATLRSKIGAAEAEVKQLQTLVDTIPDIERQLTALNRDYSVTRDQYEILLKRRESLHMTGQVEETGDQLQFRVIDPPRAALQAVGPNRPMLLSGTMVAGIGIAVGLAFLLQQLNPVFTNRRELRQVTGLPVLGSVTYAQHPAGRLASRRRRIMFAAAVGALPIALGIAILVQAQAHGAISRLLVALAS